MENKTSKYLKYAIGEIILVVIGILIALSINNWNEIRREKVMIVTYLKDVKKDLNQDIEFFKENIKQYKTMIKIKEWGGSKTKYDFSQKDTLRQYIFADYDDRKVLDNAFNKMLNSGLTKFYEYENIVNEIRSYYLIDGKHFNLQIDWDKKWTEQEILWWLNDENYEQEYMTEFPRVSSEQYNIDELINILESPDGRNWMLFSLHRKRILYSQSEKMIQIAVQLESNIDKEIKKTKS